MDVHLRDLRYFVAVAEHLHFTRAAEELFVSQPALSKQIRVLEQQLRVPLFERDRREVRLTGAGQALLPAARDVLRGWDAARAQLAARAAELAMTLVVGMSTGVGRGLLPAVRARLAVAAPDAALQIRQVPWDDPTGGVAAGDTDAAFVWRPVPDAHRFGALTVVSEPRLIALPGEHRLAGRESLDLADVLDEPFLALPAASGTARDYWLAVPERGGRPVVVGAEIANTEETVEALTAGLGICLIAAGNTPLIARDGIVIRPIAGVRHSELLLIWRRDDDRPLVRQLRHAVGRVAGALP
jgi:DNA-binding transcriptional LysR family regulator